MIARRYLVLVQQLAKGGDLLEYVNSRPRLPEPVAKKIFVQVLWALQYSHARGICHHDVKLEVRCCFLFLSFYLVYVYLFSPLFCVQNIFLDEHGNALLGDWARVLSLFMMPRWFCVRAYVRACANTAAKLTSTQGYCQRFEPHQMLKLTYGSIYYSSPEVISRKPYLGPEVDIWGLSVCLYGMVQGALPWMGRSDEETREKIRHARLRFPRPISEECRSFLSALLVLDRSRRLVHIPDILDHPWVATLDDEPSPPAYRVSPVPSADSLSPDSPTRVLSC